MIHLAQIASFASTQTDAACVGLKSAGGACDGGGGFLGTFQTIAETLIFLIGAIAVLMIIVGGLRYVLSNGDAAGLKGAKDTILYSVIGLVVAMFSYAIVAFVIGRF